GVRVLAQVLMDAEVSSQIGAELYERTEDRTAQRNGYRSRTWDTRVGTVELKVPKIAPGSYFPALLEPRRRAERALAAVICEAYVKGISTRKVDDLVRALGMDGISKSEVSRICTARAGDLRRARGPEGSHRQGPARSYLAALPGALHAQPAGDGAAERVGDRCGHRAHDLRPARSRIRDGTAAPGGRGSAR